VALRLVEALIGSVPDLPPHGVVPRLWTLRAEALARLDRRAEAEPALRAADAAAREQDQPRLAWRAQAALARLLRQQRRSAEADEAASAATATVGGIAAGLPDAALRDALLAELVRALPPPRPGAERRAARERFGGLTPREREVAAQVALGRSNREIADALFLSERTVEDHVGNVLGKLGFGSRSQIAVWAADKGLDRPTRG
jgi:DNA-binding NarL/FixJ family response regulator